MPATLKKETLAQVFTCEFCEIFKNTFLQNASGCYSCRPEPCNFARFPRILISQNICEGQFVKDVNFSEFYYFLVVVFKDFKAAIFKIPPSGSFNLVQQFIKYIAFSEILYFLSYCLAHPKATTDSWVWYDLP